MARAGLTADLVTLAAAELADELGFEQITLSLVARHVGVQVASLYSHVRSSQDLKNRIAVLALQEMADEGAIALAGRAGKDALIGLGNVYRNFADEHPGRYAAAQSRLDPTAAATSAGRRHSEMMRAILRGYELPEPDQTHAIRLLGSVFFGFVVQERGGSFDHSQPGPEESWNRILDALDALLRHWPERLGGVEP